MVVPSFRRYWTTAVKNAIHRTDTKLASQSTTRTGRDGRTTNTATIGKADSRKIRTPFLPRKTPGKTKGKAFPLRFLWTVPVDK
jgi:hypothetical protein